MSDSVRNGATVVYPTDTVYGLGCNPRSVRGLEKCFKIKDRAIEKLLPVLFLSKKRAEEAVSFGPIASRLAEHFWPGRLTLILQLKDDVKFPDELTRGNNTLAVRVPNHDCALKLIRACNGSLVGTSANISGLPPTCNAEDQNLVKFADKCDYFLRAKSNSGNSKSSTIVDLSSEEKISVIREGAVSVEELRSYLRLSSEDISTS
ncbi:MAG: L-threonylcarbamoyladenylate synthase [Nitrososphaerales archaeon]